MNKLTLQKNIKAPAPIIWEVIVDPVHYALWSHVFMAGSDFDGSWTRGSQIKFISLDENGQQHGMTSEIVRSDWPHEISIKHNGFIVNGIEDFESEMAKAWCPAFEDYSLSRVDDENTLFTLNIDLDPEYYDDFKAMWLLALDKIAELSEVLFAKKGLATLTLRQLTQAGPQQVWQALTTPSLVQLWNFADESWHCPSASNDLVLGGQFHYEMAAKDQSVSFDFWGTYTCIEPLGQLNFTLGDDRRVCITITPLSSGCLITESFEAETENNLDLQRMGWSMILKRLAQVSVQVA